MFGYQRMNAADARTDIHAEPLGVDAFGGHAAVLIRLRSRRDGVLAVEVGLADVPLRHIEGGVETADFARELALIVRDIELGNGIDAADALFHIFPGRFCVIAERRNRAQPCYDDSFFHKKPSFAQNLSKEMRAFA